MIKPVKPIDYPPEFHVTAWEEIERLRTAINMLIEEHNNLLDILVEEPGRTSDALQSTIHAYHGRDYKDPNDTSPH